MSISSLLSKLVAGSDSDAPVSGREPSGDAADMTYVHECRTCGTTVSAETTQCPCCEGSDIVTYSIE